MTRAVDVAIIGAGPYGLSAAAFAQHHGLTYALFGEPMEFWRSQMPPEMFIRTQLAYTRLADPTGRLSLAGFAAHRNQELHYPLPRSLFVEYGSWFLAETGIRAEGDLVETVHLDRESGPAAAPFVLMSKTGHPYRAAHVVVMVGLSHARHLPESLRPLPAALVSHTADHTSYARFAGRRVLVLGGGQSAWEAAALLHRAGAAVDLVYRRPHRLSSDGEGNRLQQQVARTYYHMAPAEKAAIRHRLVRPTVADFLVPLVDGLVSQHPGTEISEAEPRGERSLGIRLSDGSRLEVDHLVAATGYRFDVTKLPFLEPLLPRLNRVEHATGEFPVLTEEFEASIPGLYFAGPAAALSHGPTFQFIAGVPVAVEAVTQSILRRRAGVKARLGEPS